MKRYEVLLIELDEITKNKAVREKLDELRVEIEKELLYKDCMEEMS